MRDFIEYLLKQIVTNPDAIKVVEEHEGGKESNAYTYKIRAAKEDMGIIIGKEGRNIRSIRNVAKAKAIKENTYVNVIIEEDE